MSNTTTKKVIGFIGLGVMGEPICRNLAGKSGTQVIAYDLDTAPLQRLAVHRVPAAPNATAVMQAANVIFLSLPSGEIVAQLCRQDNGLLASARTSQTVVDLSTSPVDTTSALGREISALVSP